MSNNLDLAAKKEKLLCLIRDEFIDIPYGDLSALEISIFNVLRAAGYLDLTDKEDDTYIVKGRVL